MQRYGFFALAPNISRKNMLKIFDFNSCLHNKSRYTLFNIGIGKPAVCAQTTARTGPKDEKDRPAPVFGPKYSSIRTPILRYSGQTTPVFGLQYSSLRHRILEYAGPKTEKRRKSMLYFTDGVKRKVNVCLPTGQRYWSRTASPPQL